MGGVGVVPEEPQDAGDRPDRRDGIPLLPEDEVLGFGANLAGSLVKSAPSLVPG